MTAAFERDPTPIFIIGRQHSGNTMLATMLGRHSNIRAFRGEGNFFEKLPELRRIKKGSHLKGAVMDELERAANLEKGEGDEVGQYLGNAANEKSALEYYLLGKSFLARKRGASRWVQKATSYVFHVPTIRRCIPEATFLYPIRNPLDLAASLRRRGSEEGWGRMLWGWRQGLSRAQAFSEDDPQKFLVLRYEDIVRNGEEAFREICEFCGLGYEEACLDIPHVNRAETPYNQESEQKGLSGERVFYFSDALNSAETAAVEWMAGETYIQAFYPELEGGKDRRQLEVGVSIASIVGRGIVHLVTDQTRLLLKNPKRGVYRIWKRLFE